MIVDNHRKYDKVYLQTKESVNPMKNTDLMTLDEICDEICILADKLWDARQYAPEYVYDLECRITELESELF